LLSRHLKNARIIYVLLAVAILVGGAYTTWRTHNSSTDFDTYFFAAKRILDNQPLYQEIDGLSPYIYPPFFACALTPFALIGLLPAAFLWYLFNIALILFSIRVVSSLVFDKTGMIKGLDGIKFIPKAIVVGITAAIFLDNLSLLQVNILIFAAVLAGIYLLSKKMALSAAAAFAFAISVKVIPAVFVLYYLVKRQFRVAALITIFVVIFSALVPILALGSGNASEAFGWWRSENFEKSAGNTPSFQMMDTMFNPENQSLTAILSRWMVKNDGNVIYWKKISHEYPVFLHNINLGLEAPVAIYMGKALTLGIVIITLFACAGRARRQTTGLANYEHSLIMLTALLTTPILKSQHFTLVIFPLFAALHWGPKTLIIFLLLYASQAVRIFEIAGLGGLSVVFLWAVFLLKYMKSKYM